LEGENPMVNIKYITPKELSRAEKGKFFEDEVGRLLSKMRFKITERIQFTGMEIDILAENLDTGQKAFVECKFWSSPLQADAITTLLGKAFIKDVDVAYLFSTSEPGKEAKGLIEELKSKRGKDGPTFAFVGPGDLGQMYLDVLSIKPISRKLEETSLPEESIGNITLIVAPSHNFWAVEHVVDGFPNRLLLMPSKERESINPNSIRKLLDENELWLGLECVKGLEFINRTSSAPNEKQKGKDIESISQIPVADGFDDYRPCRPIDFVGREMLQKQIRDFLEDVRKNNTKTRIISLVGQSGFGKSSLILNLSHRFGTGRWRKKFYLYHVDARSARTPLFVAEAIRRGFESARKDGFIEIADMISIDSIDSLLSSTSIRNSFKYLKRSKKILVIFFDQFEELLMKTELFHVFENFKKLSLEVDSLQENLVIGCSWRTGITFPEDLPAYHMWHELKERRKEFRIEGFDRSEISQQLKLLSAYIGEPLEKQLKRRLEEQCLGFPWLLKKLCIHIYKQIKMGTTQAELINAQFDIEQLFKDDLIGLNPSQVSCLKYIALNSPTDVVELSERYGREIIDSLQSSRLIVRTGFRYALYWDIFRDYIADGKLPTIPLTAIPNCSLGTILKTIGVFNKFGVLGKDQLSEHLGTSPATAQIVFGDLTTFMIVKRVKNKDTYQLVDGVKNKSRGEIASYFYSQFRHHKVIEVILDRKGDKAKISQNKFQSYVKRNCSSVLSPRSLYLYSSKLLQWFAFCGLVDYETEYIVVHKAGDGENRGKPMRRPKITRKQQAKDTRKAS
jgi:Holliday junction resolvase-like predicted endonuclease